LHSKEPNTHGFSETRRLRTEDSEWSVRIRGDRSRGKDVMVLVRV
jgi:hypothetical protein